MFETAKENFYRNDLPQEELEDERLTPELQKNNTISEYNTLDVKESGFKVEFKLTGNPKKTAEGEEKQVSFMIGGKSSAGQIEKNRIEEVVAENKFDVVRERSLERSRSMVSIEEGEPTKRSNRKNTLRQKLDSVTPRSMKELEDDDCKKSSRSVSKKCVILKEKK